ncbi:hypothetical protein PsorP6_003184 [Peronosclerospora sorghi]|uniref:Uncharacterized protein n=1 Tax=Peronosclerospora sorghi TaxID=230839 RepID=A0ACC0VIF6_9STRA|nr:hypothetical protein PsorP6_003184 [Peronosclerospora sorghi]
MLCIVPLCNWLTDAAFAFPGINHDVFKFANMIAISKSSLALVLGTTAASTSFSDATNVPQRHLGGVTITTNINTYTSYEDYAVPMLAAVNKQRATEGLSPLCLNTKLHLAAQRHSDDMAAKDYMGHGGSDGTTMPQRITQAGYDWSAVAENVAAGQINVADVMAAWIESPEHLENIMGDYTMFGSAYAFNKNGEYQHYWTQDFGTSETEQCDESVPSDPTTSEHTSQFVDPARAPFTKTLVIGETPRSKIPVSETTTDTPMTITPISSTPGTNTPTVKDCEANF